MRLSIFRREIPFASTGTWEDPTCQDALLSIIIFISNYRYEVTFNLDGEMMPGGNIDVYADPQIEAFQEDPTCRVLATWRIGNTPQLEIVVFLSFFFPYRLTEHIFSMHMI